MIVDLLKHVLLVYLEPQNMKYLGPWSNIGRRFKILKTALQKIKLYNYINRVRITSYLQVTAPHIVPKDQRVKLRKFRLVSTLQS